MNFDTAVTDIRKAYSDLGHQMGYRFLLSSKKTFDSDIILLTLQPGGDRIYPGQPFDSCEHGPAHLVESWDGYFPGKSKLQVQVQKLFSELSAYVPGNRDLIHEALIAYFIPFRSPDFESLHNKEKSVNFSFSLWTAILSDIVPHLMICLGDEVFRNVTNMFKEKPTIKSFNTGWGNLNAQICIYKNDFRLVKIPHLSRFQIFNRKECIPCIKEIFGYATRDWEKTLSQKAKTQFI